MQKKKEQKNEKKFDFVAFAQRKKPHSPYVPEREQTLRAHVKQAHVNVQLGHGVVGVGSVLDVLLFGGDTVRFCSRTRLTHTHTWPLSFFFFARNKNFLKFDQKLNSGNQPDACGNVVWCDLQLFNRRFRNCHDDAISSAFRFRRRSCHRPRHRPRPLHVDSVVGDLVVVAADASNGTV